MGTEAPLSPTIPVIDFSVLEMKPGTPTWDSVKSQVIKAMEECGCFKALCKKVPLELQKEILHEMKELFELPLEIKMQNVSKIPNGGYIGKSSITPLCESIGIDDPNSLEKVQTFTNAFWPQGKSSFSKAIHSFSNQISELGERIRRMILESLGMQKYLDEHMDSSISKIRIIKYEMAKENEPKLALASHMDASIITILYQNQVDGLEIQTKSGEWISVNLSPHNFFVLIGESFHAWTNGRLHSPYHRVTVKGNDEERYTIGLFTIFKPGYTIKAPEELVDEQHPLLYRPFDILDVLQRHQALKNNQSQQNVFVPLKAYFGVV